MKLILKEIVDFLDYKAGSDGYIYSFKRIKPRKLKGRICAKPPYLSVVLRKNGEHHNRLVSRLICEAFNGKPQDGMDCSHLDGNAENNIPTNLIWESRLDNISRKKEHGTDDIGIKNSRSLFNIKEIIQIRKWLRDGMSQREIAKRMNTNHKNISQINVGKRYAGQGVE